MSIVQKFAFSNAGSDRNQHRIFGAFGFELGVDPNLETTVMGNPIAGAVGVIDPLSVQGATSMQPVKALQFALVAAMDAGAEGTLFVVVDGNQVFAFPVDGRLNTSLQGVSISGIIPIQANLNSQFLFIIANLATSSFTDATLYVNLYDYDIPPYFAG